METDKRRYATHEQNYRSILEEQGVALDTLTELVREGARKIIAQALKTELQELLANVSKELSDGRESVVRNGYLPERDILTGAGPVTVKVPKVRDRLGRGIKFTSKLIPPYLKRAGRLEEFCHCFTCGVFQRATFLKRSSLFLALRQKDYRQVQSAD